MIKHMVELDTVVAWAKRKGFVYPNSEIYGGLANAWDFGPYGAKLKKNLADLWVKHFTQERDDVVFMDTAIIAHPTTWQASGHLASFSDALIDDKTNGQRFRADKIIEAFFEEKIQEKQDEQPGCKEKIIFFAETRSYIQKYNNQGNIIGKKQLKEVIDYLTSINDIQELEKVNKLYTDYDYREGRRDLKTYGEIEQDLAKEYGVPNLSPESRGNEGMRDFILKYIPNNPDTGKKADWTECRNFNLMLSSHLGPVADDSSKVYMRPETCQSLFTDFKSVLDTTRNRIPFGLAQIGKAFRNEITPGQFLYRTREFEQMEIEYFVEDDEEKAMETYNQWKKDSMDYWTQVIGINPEHLRFKDHEKLAHYAKAATDVEYLYPRGFGEVQGVHNRSAYDLTQHQNTSGKDLQYTDPFTGKRYIPRCIEASMGLGRQVMVTMLEFYDEEELEGGDSRIVVRFPKQIAPIKFAILPLVKKDEKQVEIAKKIFKSLTKNYACEYDDSGAIGKRYRRQDEIGTPFCITIDQQSTEDEETVTIRMRDSMEQKRIKISEIASFME